MLDQFDDTLAAIHHLSKGQVKVIISPHNAHALRGDNDVPCDAYCKKIDGAFLDFYSVPDLRELYKTRLEVFFKHYPSKNFNGAPWSTLNHIILGVDLQNEPWSGIWPIVAGESWICDIATHLKETIGLGENNIAVITGGISGAQLPGGTQNFPDSAFDCKAVDVIGIHGYFSGDVADATAGTPWADMFIPGNTLTARALGKKLLLVEEWSYVHTERGMAYKKSAIWDQGNALNYRGIPWLYSYVTHSDEGPTARINVLRTPVAAIGALTDILRRAYKSRSTFNWTPYLAPPPTGLSNLTALALNPFIPEQSDCTFGCPGFLCDAPDGCAPSLLCHNSVCCAPDDDVPGSVGAACNSKKPCHAHLRCAAKTCQPCSARPTLQKRDTRTPSIPGLAPRDTPKRGVPAGALHGTCAPSHASPSPFHSSLQLPICLSPSPHSHSYSPCEKPTHCSADESCAWGLCTPCREGEGGACLGAPCKANNKCATGFCNEFARCDYAGQKRVVGGPGVRPGWKRGPDGGARKGGPVGERGAYRVRDQAVRISVKGEEVRSTGVVGG
ncbi:hypothetical protein BDV95DRAFT_553223 [Massariosphaeria phaeospora]|uniref:Glycoside hydrolase superfamily n=1 Tax=Massariosphaeria phaeospora TaxID=100035 RepID=A0A7C8I3K6_9PLEO|nr:hypothetical protein BDV95DRAFT_553223 [Massariosphaeria phaeospora]